MRERVGQVGVFQKAGTLRLLSLLMPHPGTGRGLGRVGGIQRRSCVAKSRRKLLLSWEGTLDRRKSTANL